MRFFNSINKQISEIEKNLELIAERKSEYVQPMDIPLQLIKDEERLRTQLEDLIQQQTSSEKIQASTSPKKFNKAWLVVPLFIAPILVWGVRYLVNPPPNTPPTPVITENSTENSNKNLPGDTSKSTPEIKSGSKSLVSPKTIPDKPSLSATSISVKGVSSCNYEIENLVSHLKQIFKGKDISISQTIPWQQAKAKPQLIINYKDCNDSNNIEIDYIIQTTKGPPEVYEPRLIHLKASRNSQQIKRVPNALGLYLYRDYPMAATILEVAARNSGSEENDFIFRLLQGNSLLFHYDYSEAVRVYKRLTKKYQRGVLFNNLGVAQTYEDWNLKDEGEDWFLPAISSLKNALELESSYKMPYANLEKIHEHLTSYYYGTVPSTSQRHQELTSEYCELLNNPPKKQIEENANADRLATFCPYKVKMGLYMMNRKKYPLPDHYLTNINNLSLPYWSEPLVIDALHRVFKKETDPSTTDTLGIVKEAYNACINDVLFEGIRSGCKFLNSPGLRKFAAKKTQ